MKIHQDDLVMSTMGRGFWILDNISSIRDLDQAVEQSAYLFNPKDAIRFRMNSRQSPQPGANLEYYIADAKQDVRLDILSSSGRVIRSFVSGKSEPAVNTEVDMATGFSNAPASGGLANKAGINRFNWNMRHHGGWSANPNRSYLGNGPMVSTGTYKARFTIGDQVLEKEFNVRLDPRATLVNDADVKMQEALALSVRDFQGEVAKLIKTINDERKALDNSLNQERASKRDQRRKEALDAVYYQLVTPPGTYMQPMLSAQTGYLNSMIGRADQQPGKDAYDRFEELKSKFQQIKKEFEALKED